MSTNIGNTDDPFYRYKRPMSIIEIKSGKTKIINLPAIAQALYTKESYLLYFIQLEKSTFVTSKGEIKMVIPKNEIELLINKFIQNYILCNVCKYPELVIKKHNNKLYFSCNACGNVRTIDENKFTKIIYKDEKEFLII